MRNGRNSWTGRIGREKIGGKNSAKLWWEINNLHYDIKLRYNTSEMKINRYTTTEIKMK
jgi:hypothetical protein